MIKRRTFIRQASIVALGASLAPSLLYSSVLQPSISVASEGALEKFGIQLYTLRDIIDENPKRLLKQLADFGFHQIEGFEGRQGIFWNMDPKDFKKYLDDIGLEMVASHVNIHQNFEEKAAQAAAIGMDYLVCPFIGPQKSMDDWKKVTDKFNECGAICKKNGLRFAYHNHAYTFVPFSGIMPHDFLMENTDPELVDHEMDIYWVVTGGADPIAYLEKYPNRFRLCHVKDRMKNAGEERSASCDLGTGVIDYPKILNVARKNGMKYFIMEQERYDGSTPLKSAATGAEYLKKLSFA